MTESEKLFSYAEIKDFSLLRIPYVGGYRLYVILPKKVDGLKALLQSLDGEKLRTAKGQLKSYDIVYVKIPKFGVEYSFNANDYLSSLGVGRMFTESAELNKIQPEPMIIKDIIQKTRVILDEDGTRAGAITSGILLCRPSLCLYHRRLLRELLFHGNILGRRQCFRRVKHIELWK